MGHALSGGRNTYGRLTAFRKGGGKKKLYRLVDFGARMECNALVLYKFKDPNRSSRLALVLFTNGYLGYLLEGDQMPELAKVYVGTSRQYCKILAGGNFKYYQNLVQRRKVPYGSRLPLSLLNTGIRVYNVELYPRFKGQVARAAGTCGVILKITPEYSVLRVPSGWHFRISSKCCASIGRVGNRRHSFNDIGKAGIMRNRNRRPSVRGVAMNPVDHPHGGGQGKTSGGPRPRSP